MPINDAFMLPKRVRTMEQMADLLQAEQTELTQMQRTIAALEQQLTISTSTFLLHRHETIFGLPSNPSEDMMVRRSRLLAKLVARGTTTVKTLYELIRLVTPCNAEIIEHSAEYALQITLMDDGNTPNLQAIYTLIDEVKPAHLLLRFNIVAPVLDEVIHLGGACFRVDTDTLPPSLPLYAYYDLGACLELSVAKTALPQLSTPDLEEARVGVGSALFAVFIETLQQIES